MSDKDAVHIYSDSQSIWLQLRRSVPTQEKIGSPSFKVAIGLTSKQAIAIAGELLTASTCHQSTLPPTKQSPAKPVAAEEPQNLALPKPMNLGKPWTPAEEKQLMDLFDAGLPIPQIAKTHERGTGGIRSRLIKLGKISGDLPEVPSEPSA